MDDSPRFVKNSVLKTIEIANFSEAIVREFVAGDRVRAGCELLDVLFWKSTIENVDFLSITSSCMSDHAFEYAVCVKNESMERWHVWQGYQEISRRSTKSERLIRMDTILDPRSGFLKDGTLEVQVEVRVDVILCEPARSAFLSILSYHSLHLNKTRNFNFFDPFEGCVRIVLLPHPFQDRADRQYRYVSKKMLMFHSPVFAELLTAGTTEIVVDETNSCFFEIFLQALHGVTLDKNLPYNVLFSIIEIAYQLQVLNVMRQCEGYCRIVDEKQFCTISLSSYFFKELLEGLPKSTKLRLWISDRRGPERDGKEVKKLLIAITRVPFNDIHRASWTSEPNSTTVRIDFNSTPKPKGFFSKVCSRLVQRWIPFDRK